MNELAIGDYQLSSGITLADVRVAYVSFGQLNAAGDNAVLVTHGYTSGPSMLMPDHATAEGSWANLLGPGQPLDTNRFFIVCSNMLGSAFGTTGPRSIRGDTGRPWGQAFPDITMQDIVGVQHRLLTQLGVRHLQAVLGPSYGGWQALQWALQYPDKVAAIGPIVSGLTHPPGMSAASQRQRLAASPEWHDGNYYDHGGMPQTMFALRMQTLRDYGLERLYQDREPDPARRQQLLEAQARNWAANFDAHSMIVLARAAEQFDVRDKLSAIRCRLLFAICTTDALFPPDPKTTALVTALAVPNRYFEINSPYGHLASGIEWRQLQEPVRWLLTPG